MMKKRGQAKKIPMLMKPNITLEVAQAVGNDGASFFEASLGRSDWEWKPEEDASSAESGSSADQNSSSGNESSASSKDGSLSSSSFSSSSIYSFRGGGCPQKASCARQGHKAAHHHSQIKCSEATHGEDVRAEEVGGATCTHTTQSIPPPPPTPPRSPSPSLVLACTLGLEGPHNGAGRKAWPAIALRASGVASADQYSHAHTPSFMPSP